jgi:hypothetical protein
MKPCGKCGAPIGNQIDFCDLCRTTVSAQKQVATNELMQTQPERLNDDEPFLFKIMMFAGGLALRSAFFVPVVSIGCWLVLGDGIPLYQSVSVGLAIAAVFSASDLLMHWLSKTDPDTIG